MADGRSDQDDGGGIATFVGRVRGRLDRVDAEWVAATSARLDALRDELAASHLRLVEVETRVAAAGGTGGGWPGPAGADSDLARRVGAAVVAARSQQLVDELLSDGVLAAPPTATGSVAFGPDGSWDLELVAEGGGTVARADVLLTADGEAVRDHLSARPTTDVVYTSTEAADAVAHEGAEDIRVVRPGDQWPTGWSGQVVVDVGIGADDLAAGADEVRTRLDADGAPRRTSAQPLLDAVPLVALAVAAARAAVDAATSDLPADEIGGRLFRESRGVVTTAGLSHLVTTISGLALLRIPAGLTFGATRAAVGDARSHVELSVRGIRRVRRLLEVIRTAG